MITCSLKGIAKKTPKKAMAKHQAIKAIGEKVMGANPSDSRLS